MPVPSPKTPLRADHRFIKQLVESVLGGKFEQVPSEFEVVSRVFSRRGGSWTAVFDGSPKDIHLLKQVLKVAAKSGFLTSKYEWGA